MQSSIVKRSSWKTWAFFSLSSAGLQLTVTHKFTYLVLALEIQVLLNTLNLNQPVYHYCKCNLLKDTAAGEGTVGLKQLCGNINPLALRRLAVVSQRQLVKVRQHN